MTPDQIATIMEALEYPEKLDEFEHQFIESMADRDNETPLSLKEANLLIRIQEKIN